jgi:HEPN domain-containing protein
MKIDLFELMEHSEHITYWLKSAEHDLEAAETLFQHQRYDWCLFLGHLVIEKVLKAFFIRDNPTEPIPWIHNLLRIAERTKLQFTSEQQSLLLEITQFNIKARYPDYKFEFYKKCTTEFTQTYFTKIKELYQWLLQQI